MLQKITVSNKLCYLYHGFLIYYAAQLFFNTDNNRNVYCAPNQQIRMIFECDTHVTLKTVKFRFAIRGIQFKNIFKHKTGHFNNFYNG